MKTINKFNDYLATESIAILENSDMFTKELENVDRQNAINVIAGDSDYAVNLIAKLQGYVFVETVDGDTIWMSDADYEDAENSDRIQQILIDPEFIYNPE